MNKFKKYHRIIILILLLLIFYLLYKSYIIYNRKKIYIGCLYTKNGPIGKESYDNYQILLEAMNYSAKRYNLNVEYIFLYKESDGNEQFYVKWIEECVKKYNVKYFFGLWTSSSRKLVLPILKKYNLRLFYPTQYEGFECTKYIYYFGGTPNQQLFPALNYMFSKYNKYKDVYVVGSDYIYPQISLELIKNFIEFNKSIYDKNLIYTKLYPLDEKNFTDIIDKIYKNSPYGAIIINLINGKSYYNFIEIFYNKYMSTRNNKYKKYLYNGQSIIKDFNDTYKNNYNDYIDLNELYPTIAFSISENTIDKKYIKYNYNNYFSSNFVNDVLYNEIYQLDYGSDASNSDINFLIKFSKKQNKPIGDMQYSTFISTIYFNSIIKQIFHNKEDYNNPNIFDKYKIQTYDSFFGRHTTYNNNNNNSIFFISQLDINGKFNIKYQSLNLIYPSTYYGVNKDFLVKCEIPNKNNDDDEKTRLIIHNEF